MLLLALLMVSCTDEFVPEGTENTGAETHTGELVLFTSGTTDNSASTRANTYYMDPFYRFVCQMYYKTDASGEKYELSSAQTAWMQVEKWKGNDVHPKASPGNSLYWNNVYNAASKLDDFRNDDNATNVFYWQNRRDHAFLAWTDLNHIQSMTGGQNGSLNFTYNDLDSYSYKTNQKVTEWVENGYYVWEHADRYSNFSSIYNSFVKADYLGDQKLFTPESQAIQKAKKDALNLTNASSSYRWDENEHKKYAKEYFVTETIDATHRRQWYLICFFGEGNRLVYTKPDDGSVEEIDGYVVRKSDSQKVAKIVTVAEGTEYYQCDEKGLILYDEAEEKALGWVCIYCPETKEEVDEVKYVSAKRYDLTDKNKTSMTQQPDILLATAIDHVPRSAVMEENRVHLIFKHQFAQVEVNLSSAADNSVSIAADQIESVELLGVSDSAYVFPYFYYVEDTDEFSMRATTFKEINAAEYTDTQLKENPYGTKFNMFKIDSTDSEKFLTSFNAITFGRLQAIRITWHEKDAEGGVKHVATYRVPEQNEMHQNLRLLESGTKYIWNMELRRGTLAVVRTEIIPWEINQENYIVDGSIDKTQVQ